MNPKTTGLIHHPYQPPAGFDAMPVPVHKASTVVFADTAALRARHALGMKKLGYSYGLHGTPTSYVLEERIAALEGGRHALLVPSGLAAVALVDLALLRSGDLVLMPDNVYGPSKELARHELAGWGISHAVYDPLDPMSLDAALTAAPTGVTRLVWLEAAGSVTMEFPDLVGLLQVTRRHGAMAALDNTWGSGIAFDAFDLGLDPASADGARLGVDISVHALTKYPSGGADVLMGAVTTRDDALHARLKSAHGRMGWGVAANDVELVLRSLPTLALRYAAHDQAARRLAIWWTGRPEVVQVLHPALPGSPGHAHWLALCGGRNAAAGLFSVVFDPRFPATAVDAFIDRLTLFKIGFSWAGPVSLVVPYQLRAMRERVSWAGTVVRFSVGLEDPDDLISDLTQALQTLS